MPSLVRTTWVGLGWRRRENAWSVFYKRWSFYSRWTHHGTRLLTIKYKIVNGAQFESRVFLAGARYKMLRSAQVVVSVTLRFGVGGWGTGRGDFPGISPRFRDAKCVSNLRDPLRASGEDRRRHRMAPHVTPSARRRPSSRERGARTISHNRLSLAYHSFKTRTHAPEIRKSAFRGDKVAGVGSAATRRRRARLHRGPRAR